MDGSGPIAFFSAEYAISSGGQPPIFAGGLGILAGDFLLEAGKQGIPLWAFGLAYHPPEADLALVGFSKLQELTLELAPETVRLFVWTKNFGSAKIYLLDSDLEGNSDGYRQIMRAPYGPNLETTLKRELVLSFGSIQLIRTLNLQPVIYHLNEGHTAFVILALMKEATGRTRAYEIVATKHTVISTAGPALTRTDLEYVLKTSGLEKIPDLDSLFALGTDDKRPDYFSTTKFMLHFASRANAVSFTHARVESQVHPNSRLIPLTNGINPDRWRSPRLAPPIAQYSDSQLWKIHEKNRGDLVSFINQQTGSALDPKALTIVWARRLTAFKQPDLLFDDMDSLGSIIHHPSGPVQFVIAGEVRMEEPETEILANRIRAQIFNPKMAGKVVFLPHHSLSISQILTSGADVWLNTPVVGQEACGTSGMKAGLNGALLLSTPDGWVPEVDWSAQGKGAWILDSDKAASSLYSVITDQVAPLFYTRDESGLPRGWLLHARAIMEIIEKRYLTSRMLADYLAKLYFPA